MSSVIVAPATSIAIAWSPPSNIYREKVTGARADRRELNRIKLAPGDVVTVTRIDRLSRSTFDLFGIVTRIVDAKSNFARSRNRGPTPAPAPGV